MLRAHFTKELRDFKLDVRSLVVADGETLALIGENGAGKSTVLKVISGLMNADSGSIVLDGNTLYDSESTNNKKSLFVLPEERNIGYMFQNYALFPHMSVEENISYGLKYGLKSRKMPKDERILRVRELIRRMKLEDLADKPVTQLSGGQRQRTALARALVTEPKLLLLDEPLAALDVKTQEQMRRELTSVVRSSGIPCILVTHSIVDALAMADKLAVIDKGVIKASGTPEEVIRNSDHGFVTSFSESLNLFRGEVVVEKGGIVCVDIDGVRVRAVTALSGTVSVGIRPEELIISREFFESSAVNSFNGKILRMTPEELYCYVYVDIGITLAAALTKQSIERLNLKVGDTVNVTFKATAVSVFV